MCFKLNEKIYLKIKEYCHLVNIGYTKYREEVKAGRIKTFPFGKRGILIHRDEIVNWPKRCRGEKVEGEA